MFWAPIIAAGVAGAASLGGAAMTARAQAKEAEKAHERTKEIYQHRHRWEVQDLRKAGLNPILSAGGSPPSPAGAMAQVPDYGRAAGEAVSAGVGAAGAATARRLAKAQEQLLAAQAWQAQTGGAKNQADTVAALNRAALDGQEADVNRQNPDAYRAKVLQPHVAREVEAAYGIGKRVWDTSGVGSMFNAINNAKRAHAAAEEREAEVRRRYPNRK